MSPIGGVGINLAIQDAVAAANRLVEPLRRGGVTVECLAEIQKRRMFPARLTQKFQMLIQKHMIARVLATSARVSLPFPLRMALRSGFLSRARGRMMGIGFRPEPIRTPDAHVEIDLNALKGAAL
jgi:2-polyprenyl-6-methoxyphenol hydroxylase-like FAD-dependent oxidoreductase